MMCDGPLSPGRGNGMGRKGDDDVMEEEEVRFCGRERGC